VKSFETWSRSCKTEPRWFTVPANFLAEISQTGVQTTRIEKESTQLLDLDVIISGILFTRRPSVSPLPILIIRNCLRRQRSLPGEVAESIWMARVEIIECKRVVNLNWNLSVFSRQVKSKCLRMKDLRKTVFHSVLVGPIPESD
jgi:hypothetical protein